ncbi:hypothetical protein OSTOST_22638, partial [Ostertagia ostertagi]
MIGKQKIAETKGVVVAAEAGLEKAGAVPAGTGTGQADRTEPFAREKAAIFDDPTFALICYYFAMDLRSSKTQGGKGQQNGSKPMEMVLPKELQKQVEEITKSSRVTEGIKKVINAITQELQSLRLENQGLRQELENIRNTMPREMSISNSHNNSVSEVQRPATSGHVPP